MANAQGVLRQKWASFKYIGTYEKNMRIKVKESITTFKHMTILAWVQHYHVDVIKLGFAKHWMPQRSLKKAQKYCTIWYSYLDLWAAELNKGDLTHISNCFAHARENIDPINIDFFFFWHILNHLFIQKWKFLFCPDWSLT